MKAFDSLDLSGKPALVGGLHRFRTMLIDDPGGQTGALFSGSPATGLTVRQERVDALIDLLAPGETHLLLDAEGLLQEIRPGNTETRYDNTLNGCEDAVAALKARAATKGIGLRVGWYTWYAAYYPALAYAANPAEPSAAAWHATLLRVRQRFDGGDLEPRDPHAMGDFVVPQLYAFFGNGAAAVAEFRTFAETTLQVVRETQSAGGGVPVYPIIWPWHHSSEVDAGKPWSGPFMAMVLDCIRRLSQGAILWAWAPSYRVGQWKLAMNLATLATISDGVLWFKICGVGGLMTGLDFAQFAGDTLTAQEVATHLQTSMRAFINGLPANQRPYDLGDVVDVTTDGTYLYISADLEAPGTSWPPDNTNARFGFYAIQEFETGGTGLLTSGALTTQPGGENYFYGGARHANEWGGGWGLGTAWWDEVRRATRPPAGGRVRRGRGRA